MMHLPASVRRFSAGGLMTGRAIPGTENKKSLVPDLIHHLVPKRVDIN